MRFGLLDRQDRRRFIVRFTLAFRGFQRTWLAGGKFTLSPSKYCASGESWKTMDSISCGQRVTEHAASQQLFRTDIE
jgi:hypothetical protein